MHKTGTDSLRLGGVDIPRGERATVDLPVADLYTRSEITMPVRVIRGRTGGPSLFVCAAVHGDEINGVEIIRRLLRLRALKRLRGTLIAVPVVNVFGFVGHSRYLPDRRDLNRSFPGSERGSLAARLADLFMEEVVANATHGIDLHSAAVHRCNLPQIRACLDEPEVAEMAEAFGAPVVLDSTLRDGSLRATLSERRLPMLLYEGGEALRFDEVAIRAGLRGVTRVMEALEMLPARRTARTPPQPAHEPLFCRSSTWVRAPESGILRMRTRLGAHVARGDVLGVIGDPFGDHEKQVAAPESGVVIGRVHLPLINEGDALFHIARSEPGQSVDQTLEAFRAEYGGDEDDPDRGEG